MTARYRRIVAAELAELLDGLPALAVEGARAIGKTTTAREVARTVFVLDDPETRVLVEGQPSLLAVGESPVLIDEWQRYPPSWDVVRRAVDDNPLPGRFVLTGSANPQAAAHSGAGRIVRLAMRPLSLAERWSEQVVSLRALLADPVAPVEGTTDRTLTDYVGEIVAGGFPGLRAFAGRLHRAAIQGYVDNVITSDYEEVDRPVRNPVALRRWLAAYAAAASTTATYESIRDAATAGHADKPAKTTTTRYVQALERLWILDPVPAWVPRGTPLTRLATSPKHQLVDPCLAASLLRLDTKALLSGNPMLGPLFESLVVQSLRVYAQAAEASLFHFRQRGGDHEIDYIVETPEGRIVAIEVKSSVAPREQDFRHLHWLRDAVGDRLLGSVMVTTGTRAYRRQDGIAVVPAALLGP